MALKVTKGKIAAPVRAVVYGVEGIGKTTLAAAFPNPVFFDTEEGTHQLDVARVEIESWLDLEGKIHELVREPGEWGTLVIDTIDWAERMAKKFVCDRGQKSSIEEFGFGKGLVQVGEQVAKLLDLCDQVIARGLNVLLVAHAKVQRVSPPDQLDGYDRFELKLEKQSAAVVKEWADLLLFANWKTVIVEGNDGKAKAKGGKERVLWAERSPSHDAKNRYGLPERMPFSIDSFGHVLAKRAGGDSLPPPASVSSPPGPWRAAPEVPLSVQIERHIAGAKTRCTLGKITSRVDELLSEGRLSDDEWSRLTDLVDTRHDEIEPKTEATT
jgi:hypothetical protein